MSFSRVEVFNFLLQFVEALLNRLRSILWLIPMKNMVNFSGLTAAMSKKLPSTNAAEQVPPLLRNPFGKTLELTG